MEFITRSGHQLAVTVCQWIDAWVWRVVCERGGFQTGLGRHKGTWVAGLVLLSEEGDVAFVLLATKMRVREESRLIHV